jgi:aarF domain-containing kinase
VNNAEKMSEAFCNLRGAPLKLAQMLSIQEENLIPPEIRQQFEKARN